MLVGLTGKQRRDLSSSHGADWEETGPGRVEDIMQERRGWVLALDR